MRINNGNDEERRHFILRGDPWKVLISISLPLIFYNSISHIFSLLDILIASNIHTSVASTVSFVHQIQQMFLAAGSGLCVGGGIIIARYFGAGSYDQVRKHISTITAMVMLLGVSILALIIPLSVPILKLLKMPEDLLSMGSAYFMLETAMLISIFFNNVYLSAEKAKGNTKVILYYNFLVLSVKLALSLVFIYLFSGGILMLSAASFAAHACLSGIAVFNMTRRSNPYRLSFKNIDFSSSVLRPILSLSIPVFMEKFIFSFGKVVVNSMSAAYGSMTVGALGVSNRIMALSTSPPSGVQEAESSVISQNLGSRNTPRAIGFYKRTFILNMGIGIFFFIIMTLFKDEIILLFAKGDPVFAAEIGRIYNYERYASILLAAAASVMGFLYGFGYTRAAMYLNLFRLFVFRIPPLWIIQRFSSLGSEGVGIAMFISNALVGLSAVGVSVIIIKRITSPRRIKKAEDTVFFKDC
ncbi:MATE family efflux transporter [Treponema sp. OttesenSCG-928-L16]|nr:MATE family efflux transporter [Treponema sp. OttesenSCG-928-L16]